MTHQYNAWYDAGPDPFAGRYAEMYAAYGVLSPAQSADIFTIVATASLEQREAFAFLGTDDIVHVVHRLRAYRSPLGQTSPSDGHTIGVLDECTALGPQLVRVRPALFTLLAGVPGVRTPVALSLALAAAPGPQLTALAADAADTMTVTARRGVLIPPALVGTLLRITTEGPGLTPRTLWETVEGFAQVDPALAAVCQEFVSWCALAIAGGVGGENPLRVTPETGCPLVVADAVLAASRLRLLQADFPQTTQAGGGAPGGLLQPLVGELGFLRAEQAARADAEVTRRDEAAALKRSPGRRWHNVDLLLRYCQVPGEGDLPPIWAHMAERGSREDRSSLAQFVRAPLVDPSRGLTPRVEPIITIALAQDIIFFRFAGSREDLQVGLSPFAVCFADQASMAAAAAANGLYDTQMLGSTAITQSETIAHREAQTLKLPTSWSGLRRCLAAYLRLLQVVLGEDHPVPLALHAFILALQDSILVELRFDGNPKRCAALLRAIQMYTMVWFEDQELRLDPVPPPDYSAISTAIRNESWVEPELPSSYLAAQSGRRSTNITTGGGAAAVATGGTPRGEVQRAPAAHLVPALHQPDRNVGQLTRDHGKPPKSDKGTPMCLSYHIRGSCRADCHRLEDHRAHSVSETARLKAYLAAANTSA